MARGKWRGIYNDKIYVKYMLGDDKYEYEYGYIYRKYEVIV